MGESLPLVQDDGKKRCAKSQAQAGASAAACPAAPRQVVWIVVVLLFPLRRLLPHDPVRGNHHPPGDHLAGI